MEYLSHNEAETEALGARLAAVLTPGAVVAYRGGLGMGKTAFTRGLAKGLGYGGRVTSPTFTIVNEYEGGRLPLFHFDMYRLADADALFDIGWEDYLDRGGVCAVEWSEQVAGPCRRKPSMSPSPAARRTTGHEPLPSKESNSHEDTGTGDLRQGRLRRRQ